MKIPNFLLSLLPILLLLAGSLTASADVIQTQSATSGDIEWDVTKAVVKEGILTVQFSVRNKASADANLAYDLSNLYYIDEKEKKKYHVLKDSKGAWIADPIFGDTLSVIISSGGKVIMWVKFPAPPASTTKINLVVPNVVPFEDLPISQ